MQGVEQSTANIMYFSLAEKLYPGTGYYRETGGYLGNLRNSTNIAKVRAYHEQFYRSASTVSTRYLLLRTGQPLRWSIYFFSDVSSPCFYGHIYPCFNKLCQFFPDFVHIF